MSHRSFLFDLFQSDSSPKSSLLVLMLISLVVSFSVILGGCEPKMGPVCERDEECATGMICKTVKTELRCINGRRTPEEIAAKRKALKLRKAKELEARLNKIKTETKKGEGKISFKICPFFRNTSNSVGSIVAIHTETKKKELLYLHMETSKNDSKDVFTFYSLPLGKYEVHATYGVQVRGVFDTHRLQCDPKATKRECKSNEIRLVEVVLPKDAPKDKPRECDWVAE